MEKVINKWQVEDKGRIYYIKEQVNSIGLTEFVYGSYYKCDHSGHEYNWCNSYATARKYLLTDKKLKKVNPA